MIFSYRNLPILLAIVGLAMLPGPSSEAVASDDYEGDGPGECTDRADNDRDGDFDCADSGCAGSPDCKGRGQANAQPGGSTGDWRSRSARDTLVEDALEAARSAAPKQIRDGLMTADINSAVGRGERNFPYAGIHKNVVGGWCPIECDEIEAMSVSTFGWVSLTFT